MTNHVQGGIDINENVPLSEGQLDILQFLHRKRCTSRKHGKKMQHFEEKFEKDPGYKENLKGLQKIGFLTIIPGKHGDKIFISEPGLVKRILMNRRGIPIGHEYDL